MGDGRLTLEGVEAAYGKASQERVAALISDVVDDAARCGCSLLELARACDACAASAREIIARKVAGAPGDE